MSRVNPALEWARTQTALWRELSQSTIVGWSGVDDSIGDDDEVIFLDRTSPFRQLSSLRCELNNGIAIDFATYQNDQIFGLCVYRSDRSPQHVGPWGRESDLDDLPVGRVDVLDLHIDASPRGEDDVIECRMKVGGSDMLVVAAEVRPTWTGFDYVWGDESLFVFANPASAQRIRWIPPRTYKRARKSGGAPTPWPEPIDEKKR